jgi:DNA polymerase I-like protein with 3'-5' exonuclease and polymerase domains
LGIKVDEARKLVTNLLEGMTGLKAFKEKGSAFVRKNGYVEVIPETGHRVKWWDHDKWMSREKSHDRDYWNDYREVKAEYLEVLKTNPKAPKPKIMTELSKHFAAASKWDRYALNAPTQGGGAVCLKVASKMLFDWIVDNGYFNKVLLVNLTHDEINSEFPVELKDVYPKIVEDTMAKAGAMFYHKLPLPAVAECGDHWIH